jgi:hypothetical protein
MEQRAEGPNAGRLRAMPENRKILQQCYPGWAVLIATLTDATLRAKDVQRVLGLTYRQIHHWSFRKLLWYERDSRAEWRRFSIADIFGLALIKSVADLGIPFDRLQKSFIIQMAVPGHLRNALPHLVAGREGCLFTDFENFCDFLIPGSDSANKSVEVPIDSKNEEPIIILRLKPILDVLAKKLDLADFKVCINNDRSYSFQINGVPLQLEDLRYTERETPKVQRAQETLGRAARKLK